MSRPPKIPPRSRRIVLLALGVRRPPDRAGLDRRFLHPRIRLSQQFRNGVALHLICRLQRALDDVPQIHVVQPVVKREVIILRRSRDLVPPINGALEPVLDELVRDTARFHVTRDRLARLHAARRIWVAHVSDYAPPGA